MLQPELWDRLEQFREHAHLSSVAEAVRVPLWRALDNEQLPPPEPLPAAPLPKRKSAG